jgi:hypothetical protein
MPKPWEAFQSAPGPWEGFQPQSAAEDMARSGATGVRQGVESGLGGFGDVANLNSRAAQWAAEKLGGGEGVQKGVGFLAKLLSGPAGLVSTDDIQKITNPAVDAMGAQDVLAHAPQTTAGEYSKTVGSFLPAALLPNGEAGIVQRILTQALIPGLGSEAAGQATKGTAYEPYARVAGAVAGGLAPSVLKRAVSPLPISPERQAMVDTLRREGVDLTAGQTSGRNMLKYAESELGGGAAGNLMERQGEQFTGAALRRAGESANRATPEVIDQAFNRIGQQFDDLAARNTLQPDRQMLTDLRDTFNEYGNLVPESQRAPIVEKLTNDIVDAVRSKGAIPGDVYQSLTSRIAKAARGTKDPELGNTLRGIRGALDDAMERSIQVANPKDVGAWRQARDQYRNLLVLEKAATGAGENAAQGIISPSALRNATVQQGRRAYARGQGDFAELARAGEGIMKPLPQSGTAPREAVRGMFSTMGGIAGGVGTGSLAGGALGALAGAALPPLAGRTLLTAPVRAYLGNQAAANLPTTDPRIAAIISALMTRPQLSAPTK